MKKKIMLPTLCLCLILIFTGCQQQAVTTIPTPTQTIVATSTATPEPLKPLTGSQIKDGVYSITVESSSSMFRIVDAQLTVTNGTMICVITMSGQGYGKLYMGTGEEALADVEESYISFVLDAAGAKTFAVPVCALNTDIDCAAWSIKKEKWYDRVLVFNSDAIPADAIVME